MYSRELERLLTANKVLDGDSVEITIDGNSYKGILLPRSSGVPDDTLTLKLSNGYNVGLKFRPGLKLTKIGNATKLSQIPVLEIAPNPSLPSIAIISTGGTIGTHVDYKTGGVFMSRTAQEMLSTVPELLEIVNIKSLTTPFQTASEDFSVENWQALAKETAEQLNDPEIRGVIITHGTDVLHYTSSALSFMLQNLSKPVALVGAQRSPDRGSFDGNMNMVCAAHFVSKSDIAQVCVVMHGSSSDDYCYAHRGTKVRKMHTTRRDAFRSVNEKPLAKIFPDGKIEIVNGNYPKRRATEIVTNAKENLSYGETKMPSIKTVIPNTFADVAFEEKIAMLKIYPNANPELLDFLTDKGYKGVILEATALGHVPTGESGKNSGFFDPKMSWIPPVKRAVEKGIFVGVASQALYGRTSATVYRNLRLLSDAGAIHLEDMLPETAYTKLGWVLAHSKTLAETGKLMLSNLRGEINQRLTDEEFLQ
ncbi:MAG: Glu-tRNA(Gln) amidotransferase subunit GatD [Candidatus Micrarchaeota archaeon]